MILFLGDSFTWGAGLQFEYLFQNGHSVDEINELIPPETYLENLDYKSDEYRKKHHFPNLVAKEMNMAYVLGKIGNGGSNNNMSFIINNIGELLMYYPGKIRNVWTNFVLPTPIEMVIVQFTEFMRDASEDWELNRYTGDFEENNKKEIIKQIEKFNKACRGKNLKWFGLSWQKDMGNILKKHYPNNFIPIIQDNDEYVSMDKLILTDEQVDPDPFIRESQLRICDVLPGISDTHPNSKGHKLIAHSILEKINV